MSNTPNRELKVTPLRMAEDFVEKLRVETVSGAEIQQRLECLKELLAQRFACPENKLFIEDVVLRCPWLTSDVERLKQLRARLLRVLESCCAYAKSVDGSRETCRWLIEQLSEFAEQYVETESACEELLHAAFPGPEWTK